MSNEPDGNGRRVTMSVLNDKLELVRAEQKTEHTKTRAIAIVAGVLGPTAAKALTVVGLIHNPFH